MDFIPGLELSRRFFFEAVRPVLEAQYPGLRYAAARIGPGSDVLGFDTAMSTDHDWGPSVQLFVGDADAQLAGPIHERLRHSLPLSFAGFPVGSVESPDEPGVRHMQPASDGPVEHRVLVTTLRSYVEQQLDLELGQPLDAADWLSISSQKLRETTAGAVYFDTVGDLTALRSALAFYPHDIWLYLLAAGWNRIGQEEHLMPRAGYVGDELGSALIGSRLVRDCMNLCFLMERQYAPYAKWFGTAFAGLACAPRLTPPLRRAQAATDWAAREAALAEAYVLLLAMHNALGLTAPVEERVTDFFGRPFKVVYGGAVAELLVRQIRDDDVRRIASRPLIGNIDQISDNTDLRSGTQWRRTLRGLYDEPMNQRTDEPKNR